MERLYSAVPAILFRIVAKSSPTLVLLTNGTKDEHEKDEKQVFTFVGVFCSKVMSKTVPHYKKERTLLNTSSERY